MNRKIKNYIIRYLNQNVNNQKLTEVPTNTNTKTRATQVLLVRTRSQLRSVTQMFTVNTFLLRMHQKLNLPTTKMNSQKSCC